MLRYYLWLSCMTETVPAGVSGRLIQDLGSPEAIYFAGETQIEAFSYLNKGMKKALADKCLDRADAALEACHRKNIFLVTLSDATYPDRLRNISDPPLVLYGRGRMPDFDDEAAVAFVGTRKATVSGEQVARKLAGNFARCGGLVVSGMASGIDGAACRGAMDAGKPAVAVLGGGADVCFPPQNRDIYEYLMQNGTILSEYPPETVSFGRHFPIRNRIISGLSLGTVVVEAPARSGALITAERALEQGRDLFAVPGNVDTGQYDGSNGLIKDGAKPVTDASDILEEYTALFPHKIRLLPGRWNEAAKGEKEQNKEEQKDNRMRAAEKGQEMPMPDPKDPGRALPPLPPELTEEQRIVAEKLSFEPMETDSILSSLPFTSSQTLGILTMLEILGVAERVAGNRFVRTGGEKRM